jgi:hypothetical protein
MPLERRALTALKPRSTTELLRPPDPRFLANPTLEAKQVIFSGIASCLPGLLIQNKHFSPTPSAAVSVEPS